MATFFILLDSRPAYLGGGAVPRSLLLAPLGHGTMVSHLLAQLEAAGGSAATILATFEPDADYVQRLRTAAKADVAVIGPGHLEDVVHAHEPSDWLLLADPAHLPTGGFDFDEGLHPSRLATAATHRVSLVDGSCAARECVHMDTDGCVRRIQRYYDGVTWHRTCGVSSSLVSVAALRTTGIESLMSLYDLRQELARHGVLASDLSLPDAAFDLTTEPGLLRLMERVARETARRDASAGDTARDYVRVGRNCDIHRGAQLLGHVVVHDGAAIEEGARIIGPALIGSGARIGRDASVAHCLILPESVVPSGACLRGRVFGGGAESESQSGAARTTGLHVVPAVAAAAPQTVSTAFTRAKRAVDFVMSLIGLAVLAPLLALAAVAIRLESRGSPLFGHRREGCGGREFRCWKFRTMVVGADAQQRALYGKSAVDGPQFKIDNDPRITRLGYWLRKTNIDELPQLINVLLGQMSLIGPRPSPFRENQICVPWRQARLSVRPGITGLWQLCRHERDAGDFHQWIHFDLLYVRHMSLWLDLKILLGTLMTFGGRWSVPVARLIPRHKSHRDDLTVPIAGAWDSARHAS